LSRPGPFLWMRNRTGLDRDVRVPGVDALHSRSIMSAWDARGWEARCVPCPATSRRTEPAGCTRQFAARCVYICALNGTGSQQIEGGWPARAGWLAGSLRGFARCLQAPDEAGPHCSSAPSHAIAGRGPQRQTSRSTPGYCRRSMRPPKRTDSRGQPSSPAPRARRSRKAPDGLVMVLCQPSP